MASPVGPIYASTLHRRDRAWGVRRRGTAARLRLMALRGACGAGVLALLAHIA